MLVKKNTKWVITAMLTIFSFLVHIWLHADKELFLKFLIRIIILPSSVFRKIHFY